MFDFSILKIFLTMMVGLLVLGPKRLAEIAKTAGKYWRIAQRAFHKAKMEFEDLIDEVDIKGANDKKNVVSKSTIAKNDNPVDIQLVEENKVCSRSKLSKDYRDYDVKPEYKQKAVISPLETESNKVMKKDASSSDQVLDRDMAN